MLPGPFTYPVKAHPGIGLLGAAEAAHMLEISKIENNITNVIINFALLVCIFMQPHQPVGSDGGEEGTTDEVALDCGATVVFIVLEAPGVLTPAPEVAYQMYIAARRIIIAITIAARSGPLPLLGSVFCSAMIYHPGGGGGAITVVLAVACN